MIECSCGIAPVGLDGSFEAAALAGISKCRGERPWLGPDAREECGETPRTLQRGASNVWFPAVRSAISIPPFSEALARFVDREWQMLKSPQALDSPWLIDGMVAKSRNRFTAAEIEAETRRRHAQDDGDETSRRRDSVATSTGLSWTVDLNPGTGRTSCAWCAPYLLRWPPT